MLQELSLLCHHSTPKLKSNSLEPKLFHRLLLQLKSLAGSGRLRLHNTAGCECKFVYVYRAARECELGAGQYAEDILLASLPRKQLTTSSNKRLDRGSIGTSDVDPHTL